MHGLGSTLCILLPDETAPRFCPTIIINLSVSATSANVCLAFLCNGDASYHMMIKTEEFLASPELDLGHLLLTIPPSLLLT